MTIACNPPQTALAFLDLGPQQIILLLVIGILLFGKNLPDVARSLGKSLLEFKKSLSGLTEELDITRSHPAPRREERPEPPPARLPQRVSATAPKFVENPEPVDSAAPSA
jgi:sec-independent protein translocase protein TatA